MTKFKLSSVLSLVLGLSIFSQSCTQRSIEPTTLQETENFTAKEFFRGLVFMQGPVANKIPAIREKNELTAIMSNSKQEQTSMQDFQNQLLSQIEKENPQYLENFKSAMQSGNQELISQTLANTETILSNALAKVLKIDVKDANSLNKEIASFVEKNKDALKNLSSDYKGGLIDIKTFQAKVGELVKDNPLLAQINDNDAADGNLILCLAINVVVIINVVGWVNAVAYINVATAINGVVAVFFWGDSRVVSDGNLSQDIYINSIAKQLKK